MFHNRIRSWVIVASFAIAGASPGQVGVSREWKSADGRALRGKLVSVSAEEIVVDTGKRRVTINVELLSAAGQEVVAGLVKDKKQEEADARRLGGFKEGKYAEADQGEWVKFSNDDYGLVFQLFIGREATRKKAGPLVPLFIQLHGASARGEDVEPGKVEIAAKNLVKPGQYGNTPCVVCVPLCPPEPDSWNRRTTELESMIDGLVSHLPIDRNRIYLSGYSMGAAGIGALLSNRPDYYAGALFADGSPKPAWSGKVTTPMWFYFSGERDSSMIGEVQSKFEADGVEIRADILPDTVHNGIHWKMAHNPETYEWLFRQRRDSGGGG